ncbi:MAG: hypothetical protein AAF682_00910 [Planctomycetota bacterium]
MRIRTTARGGQTGSALATALFVALMLAAVLAAVMVVGVSHKGEVSGSLNASQALYLADAGVSESVLQISSNQGGVVPTDIGSPEAPVSVKDGDFWCDITPNADGTYTVRSTGRAARVERSIEATVAPIGGNVFDHAIFAGNSSADATYDLNLGGEGGQADEIIGSVYSGGDIMVAGDASISGDVYASGGISGYTGKTGAHHPEPDIDAMDYESNHDYDVAALFAADGTWQSNALGGSAYELPESSPAHIFRKNPDDRADDIATTAKDDYFLEDPYELVEAFANPAGDIGHGISLSGFTSTPGPDGSDKVYFIDGNLWLHNYMFLAAKFKTDANQKAKVTFVVKGNVYFSDNLLLGDKTADGLAFIAIKDEAYEDSGNIYLGDPVFGTLNEMQAYLYAENDFFDNNLSEDGSSDVRILGNMSAGNHVSIDRDYIAWDGSTQHSKLTIEFDDRISSGTLELPGLPQPSVGVEGFAVVFWREAGRD